MLRDSSETFEQWRAMNYPSLSVALSELNAQTATLEMMGKSFAGPDYQKVVSDVQRAIQMEKLEAQRSA